MHKYIPWIFALFFIIYLIGFGIDIMDMDAAQYASMSREMLENKNYLYLYDMGKDYLDKPPFLIWVSALSMKIFGVNNFAYRFPSFLFSIFTLYATFKFSNLFYNKQISFFASVILASCQAFFLINQDVRTDTILMSWIIFSIWQLAAWFKNNKFHHFLAGCFGIACGMMTKGPIALVVPVFAFGFHFLLHRNFKVFFRPHYIAGILIIALCLLPMCIGLYMQFDMHPEKLVNHTTGVSGLEFFFWTQSFGRITGESEWVNNRNIFFLLQNMLWEFLPWILFFLIAFYFDIKQIIQQRFKLLPAQEAITTGGFLLTYISLGISKYQLPHYIFPVFPLAAIITAKFIYALVIEKKFRFLFKALLNFHFVLFICLWLALIVLMGFCFDTIPRWVPWFAGGFFTVFMIGFFLKRRSAMILPLMCIFSMAGINLFLNAFFYPSLLNYQMGNIAGRWLKQQNIPADKVFAYRYYESRSLNFYAGATIQHQDSITMIGKNDVILTSESRLNDFDSINIKYDVLFRGKEYPVSRLSGKFLNKEKREQQLTPYAIIKVRQP